MPNDRPSSMRQSAIDKLIQKNSKFDFLKSPQFLALPSEKQDFILELAEDVMFWRDIEMKPESDRDGFKFIAASYGLENAKIDADQKGLEGKEREKFLKPHQDLYTQFNPYSGQAREVAETAQRKPPKK